MEKVEVRENISRTDLERVLIATTDGKNIYHQVSIIKARDGSFYCNLDAKPSSKANHTSYHSDGRVRVLFFKDHVQDLKIVPPEQLKEVFAFPPSVAHVNILRRKKPIPGIEEFNPTNVIYVDLKGQKNINILPFLVDPGRIDFIKVPFILGTDVAQVHLVTTTNPWIGVLVIRTDHSMETPVLPGKTERKIFEWINQTYLDKFLKE